MDIVERLRGLPIIVSENGRTGMSRMGGALLSEAADEIEALREERNRLREAIQKITDGIYIAKFYADKALKEEE